MNVRELLLQARESLVAEPAAALESEILLCHVLAESRSWMYANPEQEIAQDKADEYRHLIQRRQRGEPIAYITGEREFWSLALTVNKDVLIPRPETELLVEVALNHIPPNANWRIADLGTGSGAIALAIASERPDCEIHATDISSRALVVARDNARRLGLEQVRFHEGTWLAPLEGAFQCILSNPPYISSTDRHMKAGDCRFEPDIALTPGFDGLSSIRHIATASLPRLINGGMLAFEHGFDQGLQSKQLLIDLGYRQVETMTDLAGMERVTAGLK